MLIHKRWWLSICFILLSCSLLVAQNAPAGAQTALIDLSARLGVALTFEDLDNWRWSEEGYTTTALGCETVPDAQPTPTVGSEFVFEYEGQEYRYYQPRGGEIYLCAAQGPQPLLAAGGQNIEMPTSTPNPLSNCGVFPLLTVGSGARIVSEDVLNLRVAPSPEAQRLVELRLGMRVNVLEGPNCDTEYTYWRVSYNGLEGWLAEGTNDEYFMNSIPRLNEADTMGCVQMPKLSPQAEARVKADYEGALNLRELPDPTANKVGEVSANAIFKVLAGPICHAEYIYWQVDYNGLIAWVAEGDATDYYVDPLGKIIDVFGTRFMLPTTVAADAKERRAVDVLAVDDEHMFAEVLPEHIIFSLTNDANEVVGTVKIFRASDYQAFYPQGITELSASLAQRVNVMTELSTQTLYLNEDIYVMRAMDSFVDIQSGGSAWRGIVVYAPDERLEQADLYYVALGLNLDASYFYQVAVKVNLPQLPPAPEATPEANAASDVFVNYLNNTVLPALIAAQPTAFTPPLEDLDRLVMSLEVMPEAFPPRTFAQMCGSFQTRLSISGSGRVLPGDANNVRAEASSDAEKVGELPAGDTFKIVQGPICAGDGAWWQVEFGGQVGWTLEGQNGDYWLEPVGAAAPLPFTPITLPTLPALTDAADIPVVQNVPQPTPSVVANQPACAGFVPSRLVVGQRGRVLPGDANNIRSAPNSDGEKLGQIPAGGEFAVLEGPTCGNNGAWWRVDFNGVVGWTLEGQNSAYWLEPIGS